jgi:membrane protease YdiL (CAAX protease family)
MNPLRDYWRRHSLLLGFLLIFLFTWAIDLTLAAQNLGWMPTLISPMLGLFVGYGFVAAALLATLIVDGWSGAGHLLRRYLIWRVGIIWYVVVLLGPLLVVLLAIGIAWFMSGQAPDFSQPFVRQIPGIPPISLLWVALIWMLFEILTNGEEIAWRGYILPRLLMRHSALTASLMLGVVWTIWHLPKFGMGGVGADARSYPFWVLGISLLAQSVLYTWVYQHTLGSLLLATLFHAAHNTAMICLPIAAGELAFYVAIGLQCLCAILVAIVTGPQLTRRISTLNPITKSQVVA